MNYGIELIIDMAGCDVAKFNRGDIKAYFGQLCELIGMKAEALYFWDDFRVPLKQRQTDPKMKGTTAIQFILTSNITIHTLELLGVVFINIFSCKEYDTKTAKEFTMRFFGANRCKTTVINREIL